MTSNEFNGLIARLANHDVKAIEKIYKFYYSKLVGAAFLILRDEQLSQDAATDAMLKIINQSSKMPSVDYPDSYMFTTTQNIAKNYIRSTKQVQSQYCYIETQENDPAEIAIRRITFYDALAKLNQDQQDVLIYKIVLGYKFEELGKLWNTSVGTLKCRFKMAKDKMKKFLS